MFSLHFLNLDNQVLLIFVRHKSIMFGKNIYFLTLGIRPAFGPKFDRKNLLKRVQGNLKIELWCKTPIPALYYQSLLTQDFHQDRNLYQNTFFIKTEITVKLNLIDNKCRHSESLNSIVWFKHKIKKYLRIIDLI